MSFYLLKTAPNNTRYAYIDGSSGHYDKKIMHPHVRYGRNAVSNYEKYTDFRAQRMNAPVIKEDSFVKTMETPDETVVMVVKKRKKTPKEAPSNFELKYMPGQINHLNLNVMALLGAAFQEMGRKASITKEELSQRLVNKFKDVKPVDAAQLNTDVLDINGDEKIDIAEYASSILVSDMLSRDIPGIKLENIKGSVNKNGLSRLSEFFNKENEEKASRVFNALYYNFHLNSKRQSFIFDKNNLIK